MGLVATLRRARLVARRLSSSSSTSTSTSTSARTAMIMTRDDKPPRGNGSMLSVPLLPAVITSSALDAPRCPRLAAAGGVGGVNAAQAYKGGFSVFFRRVGYLRHYHQHQAPASRWPPDQLHRFFRHILVPVFDRRAFFPTKPSVPLRGSLGLTILGFLCPAAISRLPALAAIPPAGVYPPGHSPSLCGSPRSLSLSTRPLPGPEVFHRLDS
ncbi:hypothetical protein B0I35DRAFT_218112 [Stachybotrys elegans]|uniref:Uncharacterized protein n=1 Tax=Stachybotrys elegans TaxID=80388 RepID=A0A8K0SSD0_9HYPO|nr:hypothetical protein B0I35DRAFT_218112 [Stachybotrys elegans]